MAQHATFGRRGVHSKALTQARAEPEPLSPELETFAASLKDAKLSDAADFAQWRRRQLPGRLLVILVGIVLMAPGLICFVAQAPWWLSLGLEAAGLMANGWLGRERRRQASAIVAWAPSTPPT